MRILLVEPRFPLPPGPCRRTHLPVGLLKIGAYHRAQGDRVALVSHPAAAPFVPDRVLITSVFTYWSQHVWEAVSHYRSIYPKAHIEVGGIYASLMPEHCKKSGCDHVEVGLYRGGVAESIEPAHDLVDTDFQIIHASRGCTRHCGFCGAWRIEPEVTFRESVTDYIRKPNVLFYDNNLLANPYIGSILDELAEFRLPDGRRVRCEAQCGLDARLLTSDLARALKLARFGRPRIAWDGRYSDWPKIKEAVSLLEDGGYSRRDIYVFMLYNHAVPYGEMMEKLEACRRWGARIADCRYRPLDLTEDNYRPGPKTQQEGEYYIHPAWTDKQVRGFRRAVRRLNIAIMLRLPNNRYVPGCEQRLVGKPWRAGDTERAR